MTTGPLEYRAEKFGVGLLYGFIGVILGAFLAVFVVALISFDGANHIVRRRNPSCWDGGNGLIVVKP